MTNVVIQVLWWKEGGFDDGQRHDVFVLSLFAYKELKHTTYRSALQPNIICESVLLWWILLSGTSIIGTNSIILAAVFTNSINTHNCDSHPALQLQVSIKHHTTNTSGPTSLNNLPASSFFDMIHRNSISELKVQGNYYTYFLVFLGPPGEIFNIRYSAFVVMVVWHLST